MTDLILAERELDVMNVLWNRGSGTVTEVQEALDADLAYTTVLTVLRTLEEKGYVTYEEEGRAHRYMPAVERTRVRRSALQRMRERLFSGSPELLMAHLVEDEGLGKAELEKIRKLVDERLSAEPESDGPEGEGKGGAS